MKSTDILDIAAKLVGGPRAAAYGDWTSNYWRVATLWNAYLRIKMKDMTDDLSADDAAMLMLLMKVARTCQGPHKIDNYIDIAGYAAGAGEIRDWRESIKKPEPSQGEDEHEPSRDTQPAEQGNKWPERSGYERAADKLEDLYSGRGPRKG